MSDSNIGVPNQFQVGGLNKSIPEVRISTAVNVPNKIPRSSTPLEPTLPKRNNFCRPSSSVSRTSCSAGSATHIYPVNYRISQSSVGTCSTSMVHQVTEAVGSTLPKLNYRPNTAASYFSDRSEAKTTTGGRPAAAEAFQDGVLNKEGCRHSHAHSMALNKDLETLAEEWYRLLCALDPRTHPGHVATMPIAENMDSYTLAYAILLVKEGFFEDYHEKRRGEQCCDDALSIRTGVLDHLLGGAISRLKNKGKRCLPVIKCPISAAAVEFMTDEERIWVLTQIYGGNRPDKPARPSSSRSRLYNHLMKCKKLDPEVVAEKLDEEEEGYVCTEAVSNVAEGPPTKEPPTFLASLPPVIAMKEDVPIGDGSSKADQDKPTDVLSADVAAQTDPVPEPPLQEDAEIQVGIEGMQNEAMQTEMQIFMDSAMQTDRAMQVEDAVQTETIMTDPPAIITVEESTQWMLEDLQGWISAPGSLEGLPPGDVEDFLSQARVTLRDLQWKAQHLRGLVCWIPDADLTAAAAAAATYALKAIPVSGQSGSDVESLSGGVQEQLEAVLSLLDAAKQKLDQRLEGDALSSSPGISLLETEDVFGLSKAPESRDEMGGVMEGMSVAVSGFPPLTEKKCVASIERMDVLGNSGLPSVMFLLQELRSAGAKVVDASLVATTSALGPALMPGSERDVVTAARRQHLLSSLRATRTAFAGFLRLGRTVSDMASLAGNMLSLLPRQKGGDSSAAAMMRQLEAAAAAGPTQAVMALSFGATLGDLVSAWWPCETGGPLCNDDVMQALRQVSDRLHGCSKDLLQGTGHLLVVGLDGAAQLGLSKNHESLPSFTALHEMAGKLWHLVETLDILYGPWAVSDGEGDASLNAGNELAVTADEGGEAINNSTPAVGRAVGRESDNKEAVSTEQLPKRILHPTALLPIIQGQLFNLEFILDVWGGAFAATWDLTRAVAMKESLQNNKMLSYQQLLRKVELEETGKLQEKQQELEAAAARKVELEAENAGLVDELERSTLRIKALEADLHKASEEAEAARREAEAIKVAMDEAERDRDDKEAAKRKLEEVEEELSGKQAALTDATKKLHKVERKLEELEASLQLSQGEVERLKKGIEELEAALKEARAVKPAPPIAEKKGCCG
ncbi:hypothetical protein CEUSTIGMA_g2280.t1 [Chlamydomonas eustigma]|uniref:Uncharacterized protein n=1 Tax=Chlamydomonas eustigma TaxID=1157962 RepID=A0A250WVG4_9CHLO|nr:hypothetical protein CEUSTIGMA_g2280.t1 [Chlamydomonas eustigma]|eukprot:GAX74834.1 hypothetical protein CEUSTIGMA_g2280.t1 [Chlamydomonas eustigma]